MVVLLSVIFVACKDKSVSVSFVVDGEVVHVANKDNQTLPENPTKEGYTFAGWALKGTSEVLTQEALASTLGTLSDKKADSVELEAIWTQNEEQNDGPIKYTITFDSRGGSGVSSITQEADTTIIKPSDPTKVGHTFKGWYINEECSGTEYQFNKMPDENITIYANWKINQYTYTFYEDDETTILKQKTVDYGSAIEIPNNPSKNATAQHVYTFAGWDKVVPETIEENITFKATYTEGVRLYEVKIQSSNTTYGKANASSVGVPYGTVLTVDANKVRIGNTEVTATPTTATAEHTYIFDSWTNGTATVTEDLTVTANFSRKINSYTVQIVPSHADRGSVDVSSVANVPYGTVLTAVANKVRIGNTEVTATANAKTGYYTYAFVDWANGTATVMGNLTVTANFSSTADCFVIKWANYDGTIIKTEEVEYGKLPSYTGDAPAKDPTPQYEYIHSGWTPTIVEVTETALYTATYTESLRKFTVTVKSSNKSWGRVAGSGIGNVEYGTVLRVEGSKLYVKTTAFPATPTTATAEYTYVFDGWTNGTATVEGDLTVTANFSRIANEYKVTFVTGEGGTVIPEQDVRYGEAITKPSDPVKAGHEFDGWYSNSECTEIFTTWIMPANNISIYAKWKAA